MPEIRSETDPINAPRSRASVTLIDVELCGRVPMSIRDLADDLGGNQHSGHQRKEMHREVYRALAKFYDVACELQPTNELAAALLLHMVARDAEFEAEPWMVELFAAHREALDELFHQPCAGRATEYGASRSDGDDDADAKSAPTAKTGKRSMEMLRSVAHLYLLGQVEDAARVAGVRPPDLRRWQHTNPHFRAACRSVRSTQVERMTAE